MIDKRYSAGVVEGAKGLVPEQHLILSEEEEVEAMIESEQEVTKTHFHRYAYWKSSGGGEKRTEDPSSFPRSVSPPTSNMMTSSLLDIPKSAAPQKVLRAPGQRLSWAQFMGGAEEVASLHLSKQELKRQEVIYEFITTESDYIRDLEIILEVSLSPTYTSPSSTFVLWKRTN
jgi:hypothetical protein